MSTNSVTVLVTAIGGYGAQIIKALRLATDTNYVIVGTDVSMYCPQFKKVDYGHYLPRFDSPEYLNALFDLCQRYKVKAVFPGCEPELVRMSNARHFFVEQGLLLPIASKNFIDICLDKEQTNLRLSALGYETPRYLKVLDRRTVETIDWFPVVVKPSVGGGGSANCYIAQNRTELMALCDYLGLENISGSFIVQEYVGTPEEEYTVGVLHDLDGVYLNAIGIRRLFSGQLNIRHSVPNRSGRKELGSRLLISSGVSQGQVGRFPLVTEQCRDITRALGACGAVNVQCRLVHGVVKVFEINPRFSGTTSLRAMVGYNEPDILIRRHLYGGSIQTDFNYQEKLIIRTLTEEVIK